MQARDPKLPKAAADAPSIPDRGEGPPGLVGLPASNPRWTPPTSSPRTTAPATRVQVALPATAGPARALDRRPAGSSWDERRIGPGGRETYRALPGMGLAGIGVPNLRRNVCPHFYVTGARGAIPIQAPHLLKVLIRQDNTASRCQLRGGVHLETGYVNDVCLTPRFNQCVFYEDELTRD